MQNQKLNSQFRKWLYNPIYLIKNLKENNLDNLNY